MRLLAPIAFAAIFFFVLLPADAQVSSESSNEPLTEFGEAVPHGLAVCLPLVDITTSSSNPDWELLWAYAPSYPSTVYPGNCEAGTPCRYDIALRFDINHATGNDNGCRKWHVGGDCKNGVNWGSSGTPSGGFAKRGPNGTIVPEPNPSSEGMIQFNPTVRCGGFAVTTYTATAADGSGDTVSMTIFAECENCDD